ncbi:uncharacterized protein P174DRAFT_59108 [Aspergillus novofumigatus IBT 16806]|uniref:NACHT domain-containing protein n=1 Tax=Aspergillus novofumigatus (strain IBT 16806) TaxID=1392255 RepID=A0A2I1BVT8_ASPN1|nr:uncharacterized protein P174DRAFT_59108 [Aspergillus novofumigatus IBT 16806]PKX89475.1 hypothetical protein P174DRAFT_59108 [Aspergillus novofumigatus IBT 16806]
MSVDDNAQHSGISAERKPYIVCFVGLDKDFETLLVDLIPDAQVLSFVAPALSVTEIEDAAVGLLDYLYDNYTFVNRENEWNSIALVTQGVTGFILKQAMNLASTDEKYQDLAFLVSDLIFIETPHRIGNGSTWQAALEVVLDSDSQPLQNKFVSQVESTCASFLCTAKKYRIVNILAPSSSLVVGNFDCRILDYWLETAIVMTGPLTASAISERIEDLERLRQILAAPHMTQPELKFPVRDYFSCLTDLSWSWRRLGDYGHWENKEFTMHGHLNHTRLDRISLFIQLIGPAGCGKKTLLRHLAITRNKSPQTTTVLLVKEDFNTLNGLQLDVLKSFICQVLWQRPFLFTRLDAYLDTFTDAQKWTEGSLWIILRFLCQARWLGRLSLYIADISDWLLPLRPLLRFLQSASAVQLSIITTSRQADLTELPPDTVVIDVLSDCDWDSGIATIIHELLSVQPWLGDPSIQDKILKHLQQCRGTILLLTFT